MKSTFLFFIASLLQNPWAQGILDLPEEIASANAQVQWTLKVPAYCEGPAMNDSGHIFFTEQKGNNSSNWPIWKLNFDDILDTGAVWVLESEQANGLEFHPDGKLVAAQRGRITRFNHDGTVDSVLATSGNGASFNQANDISIASDGRFYFTDLGSNLYYVGPDGSLKVVYSQAQGANGVEYIEEDSVLFLNEANGGRVTRFDVAEDGSLSNQSNFVSMPTPDGATFDEEGNYYVASWQQGRVFVYDPDGTELGDIQITTSEQAYDVSPGQLANTSNCTFGGPQNNILFITGDGGLFAVQLKIPGRVRPTPTTPSLAPRFHQASPAAFYARGYELPRLDLRNAAVYNLKNQRLNPETEATAGRALFLIRPY